MTSVELADADSVHQGAAPTRRVAAAAASLAARCFATKFVQIAEAEHVHQGRRRCAAPTRRAAVAAALLAALAIVVIFAATLFWKQPQTAAELVCHSWNEASTGDAFSDALNEMFMTSGVFVYTPESDIQPGSLSSGLCPDDGANASFFCPNAWRISKGAVASTFLHRNFTLSGQHTKFATFGGFGVAISPDSVEAICWYLQDVGTNVRSKCGCGFMNWLQKDEGCNCTSCADVTSVTGEEYLLAHNGLSMDFETFASAFPASRHVSNWNINSWYNEVMLREWSGKRPVVRAVWHTPPEPPTLATWYRHKASNYWKDRYWEGNEGYAVLAAEMYSSATGSSIPVLRLDMDRLRACQPPFSP